MSTGPFPLDALEIAYGSALGVDRSVPPIAPGGDPRAQLDDLLFEALRRPPCIITFSGGRDSSAVLAAAAAVARRTGLALPVPFTLRFPGDADATENEWQELVVRHLEVSDWERVDPGTSLDFLGPVAQSVLNELGLVWPANAHFVVPAVTVARGGSVVTGAFGDEIFTEDPRRARLRSILYERARPEPRDILRVGAALAPRWVRRKVVSRRLSDIALPSWLRADAQREVRARVSAQLAMAPLRWDRSAVVFPRLRYARAGLASLSAVGAAAGVPVTAPLGDPRFVAGVAATAGRVGFANRSEAMVELFGDVLPEAVLTRTSKASFRSPFWGPESAQFAAGWQGQGVDGGLVDPEALRAVWIAACDGSQTLPPFSFQAATALQAAYLAA